MWNSLKEIVRIMIAPVIIGFSLIFSAGEVRACTCIGTSLDIAMLSENIAILTLQSVEEYGPGEKGSQYQGIKRARLIVKKVFKGKMKAGQVLIFGQGSTGLCQWVFSKAGIGKDSLFFLNKNDYVEGEWRPSICGRSGRVESVVSDLAYLEKLPAVRGKTRLSGLVTFEGDGMRPDGTPNGLANVTITVEAAGGKKYSVKTDKNGFYEFYGLPAGKLKMAPVLPEGYELNMVENAVDEIEISRGELRERYYFVKPKK